MSNKLDSKIPEGDISQKWEKYKSTTNLVNPKYRIDIIKYLGISVFWFIGLSFSNISIYFYFN